AGQQNKRPWAVLAYVALFGLPVGAAVGALYGVQVTSHAEPGQVWRPMALGEALQITGALTIVAFVGVSSILYFLLGPMPVTAYRYDERHAGLQTERARRFQSIGVISLVAAAVTCLTNLFIFLAQLVVVLMGGKIGPGSGAVLGAGLGVFVSFG